MDNDHVEFLGEIVSCKTTVTGNLRLYIDIYEQDKAKYGLALSLLNKPSQFAIVELPKEE